MKRISCALLALFLCFAFCSCSAGASGKDDGKVKTATIVSAGDIFMDMQNLEAAEQADGSYDFTECFSEIKPYVEEADYAVVNMETSLGGDSIEYQGFPTFNTPDSVLDAAIDAGFDMFLTSSNHSYDLGYDALIRRMELMEDRGVDYVGTKRKAYNNDYIIVDVNGINIGFLNYTKESKKSTPNVKYLNGIKVDRKARDLICSFDYDRLEQLYDELEADIKQMKQSGADIIVCYPHWGKEYITESAEREQEIAQKMCDLGVDIIFGGHPHVVQDSKVYTSKISGKTTYCLFSMGNFISKMRTDKTRDGILAGFTVTKEGNNDAVITSVSSLPTWVEHKTVKNGAQGYVISPLTNEAIADDKEKRNSYNRTVDKVKNAEDLYNSKTTALEH